ncbi:MAG TPA: HEAT repeat domain-containing protein, partial [Clostridia bacterium]|nr:HEAT repeat domain-containing protein [Clostridia bacterium]
MNTRFAITATLILSLAGVTLQSAEPPPTPLVTQPAAHWIAVLESDAGREEKAVACRQLAVNGTRAAVPELVKLLGNQELSHMARYAMETMPGVDGALRDQLKTLQGLPLAGVIASIGVREDAKAVKPIAALLDSSDLTVVRAAARALGNIGTPAAANALGKGMASANAAALPALYDGWLKCAEKLAARTPKHSLAIYDELLAKENLPGHVRGAAVRGGIVSRGETDTAFLRQSLLSEDGTVFAAALRASSEVTGPAVTLILEEVFWLSKADRRVALVERLGMRGGVEGVAALAKAGNEGGGAAVREAAVRALGSMGKPSLPLLYGFAQSPEAGIARTACEALAGIPGDEADAVVLQLAQKGAQKRAGIELIGRRRMSGAVPVLVTFLGDADDRVRLAAVQRIGELGGAHEAVKVLDFMHGTKDAREL